jgi:hypothetical protein
MDITSGAIRGRKRGVAEISVEKLVARLCGAGHNNKRDYADTAKPGLIDHYIMLINHMNPGFAKFNLVNLVI